MPHLEPPRSESYGEIEREKEDEGGEDSTAHLAYVWTPFEPRCSTSKEVFVQEVYDGLVHTLCLHVDEGYEAVFGIYADGGDVVIVEEFNEVAGVLERLVVMHGCSSP